MEEYYSDTNKKANKNSSSNNDGATKYPPGLEELWSNFKIWDETAVRKANILRKWRVLVMAFIIGGAFFGVLSSTFSNIDGASLQLLAQIAAFISTILIALASYAGSEILTDDLQKHQIKARRAAETFKSEVYKYLFKVPPYDNNPDNTALEIAEKFRTTITSDITYEHIEPEQEKEDIPDPEITIEQYIYERLEDQIYNYFAKKIKTLQKNYRRGKNFTLGFGIAGVILGGLSSTGFNFASQTSSWIAFVTSASAAIASFMASTGYHEQINLFQATASKLKMLRGRGKQIDKNDKNAQSRFVEEVEEELSRENLAWVKELSKKIEEEKGLNQQADQAKKAGF